MNKYEWGFVVCDFITLLLAIFTGIYSIRAREFGITFVVFLILLFYFVGGREFMRNKFELKETLWKMQEEKCQPSN